jgi:hypothetical protein
MDLEGIGEPEKKPRSHKMNLEILTPARRKKLQFEKKKAENEAKGIESTASKRSTARDLARTLVEDEDYQKKLLKRLKDGIAGPIEIWLWRYAYGDPAKSDEEAARQTERYEKMRAEVLEFLKAAPERAAVLEAAVIRAPKALPLPRQPTMEELEADVQAFDKAHGGVERANTENDGRS